MSVGGNRKNTTKERQTTMYKNQNRPHITENVGLHEQQKQMLIRDQSTSMQNITPNDPQSQKRRDRTYSPLARRREREKNK